VTLRMIRRLAISTATVLLISALSFGASAGTAAAQPRGYHPPHTLTLSEAQVEGMKANLDNADLACDLIPLPYLAGLACRNPAQLEEAVNRAFYNDRGLVGRYYIHRSVMSLNYTEWELAAAAQQR
jgi:hypothetical protein